jgi:hypothetical protein
LEEPVVFFISIPFAAVFTADLATAAFAAPDFLERLDGATAGFFAAGFADAFTAVAGRAGLVEEEALEVRAGACTLFF